MHIKEKTSIEKKTIFREKIISGMGNFYKNDLSDNRLTFIL